MRHATETIFALFRELGSVSSVLVRLHEEGIRLPNQRDPFGRVEVEWRLPSYRQLYAVLTNPMYAGAYAYGRTHTVTRARPDGTLVKRPQVPQAREAWTALIPGHHPG